MKWQIYPLVTAKMVIEMGRLTYMRNYGTAQYLPVPFFILKSGNQVVMIDTSASAELMSGLRTEPVKHIKSFDEALAQVDLTPEAIDTVVLTHLMYDHCGNAKRLPNARFIVQQKELEYAGNPHPLFAGAYHSSLFENIHFDVIDGDYELMAGIDLIFTPGHSAGCQSVAVDTEVGKTIITGFCCLEENFSAPSAGAWVSNQEPEVIPPGIHLDMETAYLSAMRVKDLADNIMTFHDASNFKEEVV